MHLVGRPRQCSCASRNTPADERHCPNRVSKLPDVKRPTRYHQRTRGQSIVRPFGQSPRAHRGQARVGVRTRERPRARASLGECARRTRAYDARQTTGRVAPVQRQPKSGASNRANIGQNHVAAARHNAARAAQRDQSAIGRRRRRAVGQRSSRGTNTRPIERQWLHRAQRDSV